MDCGPAALAALLGAHGLPASVDGLRELCATDVDGTSIDELELVAERLGGSGERGGGAGGGGGGGGGAGAPRRPGAPPPRGGRYLPAILLTRSPDGYLHFV